MVLASRSVVGEEGTSMSETRGVRKKKESKWEPNCADDAAVQILN